MLGFSRVVGWLLEADWQRDAQFGCADSPDSNPKCGQDGA